MFRKCGQKISCSHPNYRNLFSLSIILTGPPSKTSKPQLCWSIRAFDTVHFFESNQAVSLNASHNCIYSTQTHSPKIHICICVTNITIYPVAKYIFTRGALSRFADTKGSHHTVAGWFLLLVFGKREGYWLIHIYIYVIGVGCWTRLVGSTVRAVLCLLRSAQSEQAHAIRIFGGPIALSVFEY